MENACKALNTGKTTLGIKGPTFLFYTGCDIPKGSAIVCMHTVMLGLVCGLIRPFLKRVFL